MSVLILSANTGQGHNSCARALQGIYAARGIPCEIRDTLAYLSPEVSKLVSEGHVLMYRKMPRLLSASYHSAERHPKAYTERSPLYKFLASGVKKLLPDVQAGGFDTIICVHVFASLMVTELRRRYPVPLRTAFLATDYTCSPTCADSRLDRYFVPPGLTEEFVRAGLPQDRILETGIPIRGDFHEPTDPAAAKAAFGVDPVHRHLLVMCGSMGCGPMEDLVQDIGQKLPENCELTVVCGTNHSLYRRLTQEYGDQRRIHVQAYVENMSELMDSADLYLTKPGGISVTEATRKRLPMVLVNAVAGCEDDNLRYFTALGAAVTADTPEELSALCLSLLADPQALSAMAARYAPIARPHAGEAICDALAALSPSPELWEQTV